MLSEFAEIEYLTTGIYNPKAESGIRWNDPDLAISWPTDMAPLLSAKDGKAPTLNFCELPQ